MSPEGKSNLEKLFRAGKFNARLATEVTEWFLPEIEAVADLRFPDALMPVAATYDELLGLIYLCWSADEVEAVAAAYFAEVRLHAVGKAT